MHVGMARSPSGESMAPMGAVAQGKRADVLTGCPRRSIHHFLPACPHHGSYVVPVHCKGGWQMLGPHPICSMDCLVRIKCLCHNHRQELDSRIMCFVYLGAREADSAEIYLLIFVPQPLIWHEVITITAMTY